MSHPRTKEIRNRLGINQVELAAILNVHPITVSHWENGRASPKPWATAMLERFQVAQCVPGSPSVVLATQGPIGALYFLLQASFAEPGALFDAIVNPESRKFEGT